MSSVYAMEKYIDVVYSFLYIIIPLSQWDTERAGLTLGPPNPKLTNVASETLGIRRAGFSPAFRYLCRHSRSRTLQQALQLTFTAFGMLPYHLARRARMTNVKYYQWAPMMNDSTVDYSFVFIGTYWPLVFIHHSCPSDKIPVFGPLLQAS